MKVYLFLPLMLILSSCAMTNQRKVSSISEPKTELIETTKHDLKMVENLVVTSRQNGFGDYLETLNLSELDQISVEVKELKTRAEQIHNYLNDWSVINSQTDSSLIIDYRTDK